jgi:hypothetical protein
MNQRLICVGCRHVEVARWHGASAYTSRKWNFLSRKYIYFFLFRSRKTGMCELLVVSLKLLSGLPTNLSSFHNSVQCIWLLGPVNLLERNLKVIYPLPSYFCLFFFFSLQLFPSILLFFSKSGFSCPSVWMFPVRNYSKELVKIWCLLSPVAVFGGYSEYFIFLSPLYKFQH